MDVLSLFILIFALYKKDRRCLPVCAVSAAYCISHSIFLVPATHGTVFYDFFRFINIPFLAIVLLVSVLTFRHPFENGKRYVLPIILNASALVIRIIRRIFFHMQGQQVMADGADIQGRYDILVLGCTILDVLFICMFFGMMICLIIVLRRKRMEINP